MNKIFGMLCLAAMGLYLESAQAKGAPPVVPAAPADSADYMAQACGAKLMGEVAETVQLRAQIGQLSEQVKRLQAQIDASKPPAKKDDQEK